MRGRRIPRDVPCTTGRSSQLRSRPSAGRPGHGQGATTDGCTLRSPPHEWRGRNHRSLVTSVAPKPHHAAPSLFVSGLSAGDLKAPGSRHRARFPCTSVVDRRGVEPLTSTVPLREAPSGRGRTSGRDPRQEARGVIRTPQHSLVHPSALPAPEARCPHGQRASVPGERPGPGYLASKPPPMWASRRRRDAEPFPHSCRPMTALS